MKPDYKDALMFALDKGAAEPQGANAWRFYNALSIPGLDDEWKEAIVCEQEFRPEYLKLQKHGYEVTNLFQSSHGGNQGAIFFLGRNRLWNQHKIARIWNRYAKGKRIIIAGAKNGGIVAIRKWFAKNIEITDSISKHHSVVFWADKQANSDLEIPKICKSFEGYKVSEGMFSSNAPDKGSKLLVEHFDNRIKGKVADLGAGWGYLSGELLKKSENITELDLFEADSHSLLFAEKNLSGNFEIRVSKAFKSFHWCDVTTEFKKKPYQWVIMNPPFHSGRAAEPELGRRFIQVAASTLPSGGRLLMVANRNLPYEDTLNKVFRHFKVLEERDGFKVIEAVK